MTAREIALGNIAALLADPEPPPCRRQTGRTLADYEADIERRAAQVDVGRARGDYRTDGLCPRCERRPRAPGPGQAYCVECRREIKREWDRRNRKTGRAGRRRPNKIGATT